MITILAANYSAITIYTVGGVITAASMEKITEITSNLLEGSFELDDSGRVQANGQRYFSFHVLILLFRKMLGYRNIKFT